MDRDNWSNQFNSLLSSPLGAELIRELNERHNQLVSDAEGADNQEKAYGLLKQASGVILAIEHLQFLSVVSTDEGSKDKKY